MAKILSLSGAGSLSSGVLSVAGRSSTTSNFMFITAQDFHPEELIGLCAKYINGKLIVTKSDEQVDKIVKRYKIQKEVKKKFNQLKKYKIIKEQIC